jgi:hypothetical protein
MAHPKLFQIAYRKWGRERQVRECPTISVSEEQPSPEQWKIDEKLTTAPVAVRECPKKETSR